MPSQERINEINKKIDTAIANQAKIDDVIDTAWSPSQPDQNVDDEAQVLIRPCKRH